MIRAAALGVLCALAAGCGGRTGPPETARGEEARTYHGQQVAEPYAWLEAMGTETVGRWARLQDEHAREFLNGGAGASLRDRIHRVAGVTRFMPPLRRGDRYFYVTFDAAATKASAWVQEGLGGTPRLVLDEEVLAERDEVLHRQVWPSPDGRFLAYGLTGPGSRWMEVRFRDPGTGDDLPDRLTGLVAFSSTVSWSADSSGVYYERFDRPPPDLLLEARLRNEDVLHHVLGTSQEDDSTVFDSADPPDAALPEARSDDLTPRRDLRRNYGGHGAGSFLV